jgi:hypothetical protein
MVSSGAKTSQKILRKINDNDTRFRESRKIHCRITAALKAAGVASAAIAKNKSRMYAPHIG